MNTDHEVEENVGVPTEYKIKVYDWKSISVKLNSALKMEDIETIKIISLQAILDLKKQSQFYCMSRYLLESIYRFAYFIPIREQEALSKRIKSPHVLIMSVIHKHILALLTTVKIDHLAAPIQAQGIVWIYLTSYMI